MRKKFLGCALATALSVLGLVGCGAGDTETVTSADSAAEVQVSDKTDRGNRCSTKGNHLGNMGK